MQIRILCLAVLGGIAPVSTLTGCGGDPSPASGSGGSAGSSNQVSAGQSPVVESGGGGAQGTAGSLTFGGAGNGDSPGSGNGGSTAGNGSPGQSAGSAGRGGSGDAATGGSSAAGGGSGGTLGSSSGGSGGAPAGSTSALEGSVSGGAGSAIPATFETVKAVLLDKSTAYSCFGAGCHEQIPYFTLRGTSDQQLYTLLTTYTTRGCGPAIDKTNPAESGLIKFLRGPCGGIDRMPLGKCWEDGDEGCVPPAYIDAIERWIAAGATR